jgi:hypothetical protein
VRPFGQGKAVLKTRKKYFKNSFFLAKVAHEKNIFQIVH